MTDKPRACLAIGIGVTRELDDLPGAVTGAEDFAAWATKAGYETRLVTDRDGAVDIGRVRAALLSLLPSPRDGSDHEGPINPPERLLLYFAGHGMHSGLSSLWLLTNTYYSQEAIGVSQIQDMLASYGIQQLAVVSDACLSPATREWTVNIVPHAVLPLGPYDALAQICDVDQFVAVQRYQQAFMLREREGAPARCIFSGVLMEALHGARDDLFDPDRRVTSDRLARFLRKRVPSTAARYKVAMVPQIRAGWLSPDDLYVGPDELAAMNLAPLPPWPDIGTGDAARPVRGESGGGYKSSSGGQPDAERRWASAVSAQKAAVRDDAMRAKLRAEDIETAYQSGDRLTDAEGGCGLTVSGANIEELVYGKAVVRAKAAGSQNYALELVRPNKGLSTGFNAADWCLVTLEDGRVLGSLLQHWFITDHIADERGGAALVLRPMHENPRYRGPEHRGRRFPSEAAIAAIEQEDLGPDRAADLAIALRKGKHSDPMLGIISAYLYHAVGDIDSIRRMAWFYHGARQPVPYDIALLARIACTRDPHGALIADVPAIAQAVPRTESEAQFSDYLCATTRVELPVAGRFPLMRAGWFLLGGRDEALVPSEFSNIAGDLASATFTTLSREAGAALAKILKKGERT